MLTWKTVTINFKLIPLIFSLFIGVGYANQNQSTSVNGDEYYYDWPLLDNMPPVSAKVLRKANKKAQKILKGLSLDEKIGQIAQGEIQGLTPDDIRQYCLGSVLNGGGSWPNADKNATPAQWRALADEYWQAGMDGCGIPPIWGIDSVHGNNNVIGATLFPHNIGLGAANNPELMKSIGEITAKETRATGQPWVFAPTVAVARDDRWGRTYESFSEDPKRVSNLSTPLIEGLQGDLGECSVAATIKHWVGDGGTTDGQDQGDTQVTEDELINIHALPYFAGLESGALSAMPSFSSWNGEKLHGNNYLIGEILKGPLGFSGHIISDWNGIGQVTGCTNSNCPQAVDAGIDLFMVPYEWRDFIATTKQQVQSGVISIDRINDAVKRILRNKILIGLFDQMPSENECADDSLLGKDAHRQVARQAVRESLVLLKNNDNILPLEQDARILVTGKSANNLANQNGGWTITWQGTGTTNADFPGATSIYEGIAEVAPQVDLVDDISSVNLNNYDVAVVAIGETPYAEGLGDIRSNQTLEHARLTPEDVALLEDLQAAGIPVVTLWVAGRPLYTNKEMNLSNAFVAAWLPGSEGGGIADVLFALPRTDYEQPKGKHTHQHKHKTIHKHGSTGKHTHILKHKHKHGQKGKHKHEHKVPTYDFTGTLPMSWPGEDCQTPLNINQDFGALFAYGIGLTYKDNVTVGILDESSDVRGCGQRNTGPNPPTTEPLEIFVQGGNISPWQLQLGDPSNWSGTLVDLSDPNAVTSLQFVKAGPRVDSPTFQSGAISVEHSFNPNFNGPGQFYAQGNGASGEDLSAYINSPNSALVFSIRQEIPPNKNVSLRIDCVFPCIGEVDVTSALSSTVNQQWHELAIPLSCFAANGTDFSNVNTPFLMFTEANWSYDIAEIRWEPDYVANVDCNGVFQP